MIMRRRQKAGSAVLKVCSVEPRGFSGYLQAHHLYEELRKHNLHHLTFSRLMTYVYVVPHC